MVVEMRFADAAWWEMVFATVAALHVEEGYPLTPATAGPMCFQARELGKDVVVLRAYLRAQPRPDPVPVPPPVDPPVDPPVSPFPHATREDGFALVVAVKADLERRGVSLVGPCGAFEITKRVAWHMRNLGAGVLEKTGGNRCEDRSVDVIVFRDGGIVDVLIASGGEEDADRNPIPGTGNVPSWQTGNAPVDPNRWKAPTDPGDVSTFRPRTRFEPPIGDTGDPRFTTLLIQAACSDSGDRVPNAVDYTYWTDKMPELFDRGIEINYGGDPDLAAIRYAWAKLLGWQSTGRDVPPYGPYAQPPNTGPAAGWRTAP